MMHGTRRVRWPRRLLHVHGQAQAHVLVTDDPGRALAVGVVHEGGVHGRDGHQALDHGVADQVGEADLAAGGPEQLVVDDGPVDLEQLGRHHPHTGGGGHAEGRLHVGHDATGGAPERSGDFWLRAGLGGDGRDRCRGRRYGGGGCGGCYGCGGRYRCGGCPVRRGHGAGNGRGRPGRRRGCGGMRRDGCQRSRSSGGPVVGEELTPRVGDRGGIGPEPVVHVLDQPGVGTECPGAGSGALADRTAGVICLVVGAHRAPSLPGQGPENGLTSRRRGGAPGR